MGFRKRTTVDGDDRGLRPAAIFVNGPSNEFFTGAALSGNKNAAGLRSNRLDHVENGAHLRTLSDNIVQTGEPPNFTAQVSGVFLPFQVLSDFMHREAQLNHQGGA